MTATRLRARFPAMVLYVLQACLPGRRRLALAVPCVAAVLFGLLTHSIDDPAPEAFASVAGLGLFGLVLPLGALVIGDAVLGAEVRTGTLAFTWLSPAPFRDIVLARWLGGWLIALASLLPACLAAALVAGVPSALGPLALAVAAGTAAHLALFVLIGCVTRRAAVWSLAVVLLVERLLGAALSGIAQLSPTWEARAIYADLGPSADDLHRSGIPEGWAAVVRLVLVTVVCLAIANWRLRRLSLSGARD